MMARSRNNDSAINTIFGGLLRELLDREDGARYLALLIEGEETVVKLLLMMQKADWPQNMKRLLKDFAAIKPDEAPSIIQEFERRLAAEGECHTL